MKKPNFDLQASPKCLELLGWDKMREIANFYIESTPDIEWYPESWLEQETNKVKILVCQIEDLKILILTYRDKDGTCVVSFDPARDAKLSVTDGHQRMRQK